MVNVPRVGWSTVAIIPRALRCSLAKTSPLSSTAPHGTPASPNFGDCYQIDRIQAAIAESADSGQWVEVGSLPS